MMTTVDLYNRENPTSGHIGMYIPRGLVLSLQHSFPLCSLFIHSSPFA